MSEDVPKKPGKEVSGGGSEPVLPSSDMSEADLAGAPKVTFRGNTYDLLSLGALATGALVLFTCVTCNMGYYCLPFISIVLGAIGVLSARQAVDEPRTRRWSWLGIAAGAIILLLMALCFVLYIGFIAVSIISSGQWD
jgi:hypothetical protein